MLDQIGREIMGRFFKSAAVLALVVAYIMLSMNSWSLSVEARIPQFSATPGAKFFLTSIS